MFIPIWALVIIVLVLLFAFFCYYESGIDEGKKRAASEAYMSAKYPPYPTSRDGT